MSDEIQKIADHVERSFLKEKELARRWNVSPKKLQNQRARGTGVIFSKFDGCVRYRLADVEAYEEASRRRCTRVTPVSKPPQE